MGIPNLLMVRYELEPKPPFQQFARPLAALDRVVWSIEGGGGGDGDAVLELDQVLPNLCGVMLDDYFQRVAAGQDQIGPFSLAALADLRARLQRRVPPLDIWVVLYTHEFEREPLLRPHLQLCDVVTMWTWNSEDLALLERNFADFDKIAGDKKKILGIYMWDYPAKKPMTISNMETQCKLALHLLKAGRIEGMIFLASCLCDLDLEAVSWVRDWIVAHGSEKLG